MKYMLSEYKDKQVLVYNLLCNDILNNCVTHAYLFDQNNCSDSFDIVMSFVKAILCEDNNILKSGCENCPLCKRIDEGNYPEVKVISPDGLYIKKQQIIDLQNEFSRAAVEGKKRIYIIRDCDKMRTESANSMLKFLEEPEEDIVAILMTNNINNVLSTIISRCKVIKLNNDNESSFGVDDELEEFAVNFLYNLEKNYFDVFVNIKDFWFSKVPSKEREKMIFVFDRMIDIYYDIMKNLMGSSYYKCSNYVDKILELSKMNTIDGILKKLEILMEAKDSIKFNVNTSLLMDSFIVSIGGITDGSRY